MAQKLQSGRCKVLVEMSDNFIKFFTSVQMQFSVPSLILLLNNPGKSRMLCSRCNKDLEIEWNHCLVGELIESIPDKKVEYNTAKLLVVSSRQVFSTPSRHT